MALIDFSRLGNNEGFGGKIYDKKKIKKYMIWRQCKEILHGSKKAKRPQMGKAYALAIPRRGSPKGRKRRENTRACGHTGDAPKNQGDASWEGLARRCWGPARTRRASRVQPPGNQCANTQSVKMHTLCDPGRTLLGIHPRETPQLRRIFIVELWELECPSGREVVREAGRVTGGALSSQTSNGERDAAPSAGGDKAEPENHSE